MQILTEAAKSQPDRPDLRCSWLWGGQCAPVFGHTETGTDRYSKHHLVLNNGVCGWRWEERVPLFPGRPMVGPKKMSPVTSQCFNTFLVHDKQTNK